MSDVTNKYITNLKHGYYYHPLYKVWRGMIERCYYEKHKDFKSYGGRGISVCDEWLNIPNNFCDWGVTSGYKSGLTLDRKDTNDNYSPENCRWVTNEIQSRNKRNNINITIENKTQCLKDWCDELNINYSTAKSWSQKGKNLVQKISEIKEKLLLK